MTDINWSDARTDYVTKGLSYRQIAEKYGVTRSLVMKYGARWKWVDARKQFCAKREAKKEEAAINKSVSTYERVINLSDRLLDKIEQAINELDLQVVEQSTRTKVIEYNNKARPDKATKETITDVKTIDKISTIIDRDGIKQLAASLQYVKDIQGLKADADVREQEARIKKLQNDAEKGDNDTPRQVTVRFEAVDESFAE